MLTLAEMSLRANSVMNQRKPEWLVASSKPAAAYRSPISWLRVFGEKMVRFCVWLFSYVACHGASSNRPIARPTVDPQNLDLL